ncbi:cytochrome P450 [Mycena alexandri]|uniref:Cytochrome P450 n=1 Tax=Mycena alexandri TaxID=1745969 RepID=A0AAD6TH11_9AGAR|nr:cytochrome P450 [Mycena alexandri]
MLQASESRLIPLVAGGAALLFLYARLRKRAPLPPGPTPLPIVGNILNMPAPDQLHPWKYYDTWFQKYGNIVYVKIFQQDIVLLGSYDVAQDLFDKNGAQFSDRPANVMIPLTGWDFNFAAKNYTPFYRRHRKTFHEFFNPTVIPNYRDIQYREVEAFIRRLEESPDRFLHHIRHTLAAVIMDVAYGIRIRDTDDPYISVAEEAVSYLNRAGIAGSFIVDFFPWLQHFPSWAPGTSFQATAKYAKTVVSTMVEKPWKYVANMAEVTGDSTTSVAGTLYSRLAEVPDAEREEQELIAKNVSGVAYAAGADTTSSAVQSFFLAMLMFPEVQQKAREELDRVVGRDRLPNLDDRKYLPYVGQALIKEIMRWQPVSPLGVPHCNPTDFMYNGYLIPAGTMLLGSAWAILHDPEMYPDPDRFYPERFLKDGVLNPDIREPDAAFGFGRRICPGRYMSDNNVFLIAASVLSRFEILPSLDDQKKPIKYEAKSTNGLFTYPLPFNCQIRPRA